jgi:hypothetical protein
VVNPPAAPARPGISPAAPVFEANVGVRGVMFGLPMYGGQMFDGCLHGLLETQAAFIRQGLGFNYAVIRNESLIQRARNGIVARFLASECSHLFFIDADIGFTAHAVLRLLAHDRPLVGGLYRKKNLARRDWAFNPLRRADGQATRDERTGAMLVENAATGFLCIRRDVLETMVRAFPHLKYRAHAGEGEGAWTDHLYTLFDCWVDPATGTYWSEDYGFCQRWRALGGEVWVDPGILLQHWGTACFEGDPMDDFTPA